MTMREQTPFKAGVWPVSLHLIGALSVLFSCSGMRADAQVIRTNPGFTSTALERNDDSYTPAAQPLGFTINFFGNNRTAAYVTNNGNIAFTDDGELSTYTPQGLTALRREIIAPFFADVDTRNPNSDVVRFGRDTVNGRPAFAVTYRNVGYYDSHADKLNSFQVVLIERSDTGAGNFDIEFNYEKILWETGDASSGQNGFGGTSAAVGYSNGSGNPGTFFEQPGSRVPGAFLDGNPNGLIHQPLNGNTPGRLVFQARSGSISPLSLQPSSAVAASGGFTLKVFGAGFISGSTVVWNGTPLTTTFVSSSELDATVPASLIGTPGSVSVSVSGISVPPATFQITAPLSLQPSSAAAGGPGFTLMVFGTGFTSGSTVQWNGSPLTTTFVSATEVDAAAPASLIATQGTASVSVSGITAPAVPFQITPPVSVTLSADVNQLVFNSLNGLAPPSQTINVSATNNGHVFVTAAVQELSIPGITWLTVPVTPPGTTPTSVLVTVSPAGLGAGSYFGNIIISGGSSTITVPVVLSVTIPPPPVAITSSCPASPAILNTSYSQSIGISGGAGGYTLSISGALPPGLSLNGTTISGTPTKTGSYNFVIQVASGGQTAQLSCGIRVDPPPLHITSGCPPGNGTQGVAYGSFNLTATGGLGTGTYIFSILGSLPGGLSLSGNTISGIPTGPPGSSNFRIQVTSGTNADTTGACTVAIAAPPFPALQLSGTCPGAVPANSPVSIPLTASGGNGTYRFSLSGGSSGLTLASNGTSATLTGTPTTPGTYPFSVTLTDTAGSTPVTFQCTLTVTAPALILSGSCPGPVVQGGSVSATFTAAGGQPPYSWNLSSVQGLSLTSPGGLTTSITGSAANAGTFPFTITLSDTGGQTKTQACTLSVTSPPPAPLAITAGGACPTTLTAPANFTVPLTGAGGTPPYSWSLTTTPAGTSAIGLATVSGTNTSVSGALTNPGTYGFSVTLSDAAAATPATFSCSGIQVNAPPIPSLGVTIAPPRTLLDNVIFTISLASPASALLQGVATLTFTPNAVIPNGATYTGVRFSNNSTTAPFSLNSGQTTIALPAVQQGTVAGNIHIQVTSLTADGVSVLPNPAPAADLTIPKTAPVITDLHLDNQTATGFTIVLQGYSTPRDISKATISFTAASDASIDGQASFELTSVGTVLTTYYADPTHLAGGSAFDNLRIPISIDGDASAIAGITVTLTNSAGTSDPKTVSH